MLRWIKRKIAAFIEGAYERQIQRLTQKTELLKAELEILSGGKPIVSSEEERARLGKAREGIDPGFSKELV